MEYYGYVIWSPYKSLRFLAVASDEKGPEAIKEMGCSLITELGNGPFPDEKTAIAHFRYRCGPVFDVVRLWLPIDPESWRTDRKENG